MFDSIAHYHYAIPDYSYSCLTSTSPLMTTSFCKADEEFIHPNIFDLVISGLFELKIHIGCRRIRTSDMTLSVCLFVETIDYHSAMRRFCNHLLEMNVSLSIYKHVDMNFMTKNVNLYEIYI